jgi:hypothetical protein
MVNRNIKFISNSYNLIFINIGWGQGRFEGGRPISLPPPMNNVNNNNESTIQLSSQHRMSAESSSESEASGIIRKDSKDKSKSVFRMFSKKKAKN